MVKEQLESMVRGRPRGHGAIDDKKIRKCFKQDKTVNSLDHCSEMKTRTEK